MHSSSTKYLFWMFPSIFKEITRRPEDNGKKMVSKKKFINYKNHFEGVGGLITIN